MISDHRKKLQRQKKKRQTKTLLKKIFKEDPGYLDMKGEE